MAKNEYRRALIVLRACRAGLSGHVRLERRTLMGSMQFSVSGLDAQTQPVQAAMAAKTQSGWKIVHIGTLGRDSRGQAGLNWTFDPRAIEGLPLEKYSVFLVLQTGDQCRVLLTGYVNGSVQVDWERVEQAACQSYVPEETPVQAEEAVGGQPEEILDQTEETAPETTAGQTEESEPETAADDVQTQDAAVYTDVLDVPARVRTAAIEELSLAPETRWPEGIEPLREIFARETAVSSPALEGYVFVRHGGAAGESVVGVKAENGVPVSVAYGVRGQENNEAPEGMEGYRYMDGWWLIEADAQTGEYLLD